ncbi:EamA family transporter [Brevibacterium luteolum]|uniref:EamA family transporter n=1 Tax=Brevibacterium luteolum TaxID=199591 RepID=UPI00223B6362|nr:DMT family transporter [Brevibacterium luteolum]
MNRQAVSGLVLILLSAFCYAAAAPIGKVMYAGGWTPEVVVFLRVLGTGLVLLIPTLIAMHGRWHAFARWQTWRDVITFGIVSVAGVQLLFFMSVEHLDVAIALLLEMTAPLMIVVWVWLRSRIRPSSLTFVGMGLAMFGLAFILDPRGAQLHLGSVLLALGAAVCLACYFLDSAKAEMPVPPIALVGFGMFVGAAAVGVYAFAGPRAQQLTTAPMSLGSVPVTWWQAIALIVLVTAGAYVTAAFGIRMIGATVASFVNLIEVPFSVVIAWAVLAELPVYAQAVGGLLLLAGVVFIKIGERRTAAREVVVSDVPVASLPVIEHVAVPEAVRTRSAAPEAVGA